MTSGILQGENDLSDYQFGTKNIHHLFCRHCGIKPFGRGHMDALGGTFYAVNVACLDGTAPEEMAAGPIQYQDGQHNAWDKAPAETRAPLIEIHRDLAEHFDEALDVLLVVVDVRADAQPAEPRRGIDVLRGELLGQIGRHALGEAEAEHVRRAQLRSSTLTPGLREPVGQPAVSIGKPRRRSARCPSRPSSPCRSPPSPCEMKWSRSPMS